MKYIEGRQSPDKVVKTIGLESFHVGEGEHLQRITVTF